MATAKDKLKQPKKEPKMPWQEKKAPSKGKKKGCQHATNCQRQESKSCHVERVW